LVDNIFRIKRGDTEPVLRRQLLQGDGTPIPALDTAQAINLVMRLKSSDPLTDPVFLKKPCVLTDAVNAWVEFRWAQAGADPADTWQAGAYWGEIEIVWGDGSIETVPTDGFIDMLIEEDLG
jgi:hypothetical protein